MVTQGQIRLYDLKNGAPWNCMKPGIKIWLGYIKLNEVRIFDNFGNWTT